MSAKTWDKYVCELIDYESTELYSSNLKIKENGHIYRQFNDVNFYKQKLIENDENEHLFSVSCNNEQFFLNLNSYQIDENENICSRNTPWFCLKKSKIDKKSNYFKITEGDVIKIGKIIIRVRKIKFEPKIEKSKNNNRNSNKIDLYNSFSVGKIKNLKEIGTNAINDNIEDIIVNNDLNSSNKENYFNIKNEDKAINNKNSKICRICYQIEENENDPLIHPCLCSGSLKYIHLNCLKQWLGTRNSIKVENNEYCNIYMIKEIDCEICKSRIPDYIRHNNKLFKIIDFKTNFKNYFSFENLTLDKQKYKYIYIINLDKNKKIKIGRGHESNVLLSDISISRVHCFINVEDGHVFLEDNDSKYGTLVLIQTSNINLTENIFLNIQIGRSFINCKIKKPFRIFGCCDIKEKADSNFYYKQNEKKMKKILTVKTEEESKYIEEEVKDEVDDEKDEKIDIDVDEDDNLNRTCLSFSKYNFRSKENFKNLLNSANYKGIEIISPLKMIKEEFKNISTNINNTEEFPLSFRNGRNIYK